MCMKEKIPLTTQLLETALSQKNEKIKKGCGGCRTEKIKTQRWGLTKQEKSSLTFKYCEFGITLEKTLLEPPIPSITKKEK